MFTAAVVIATVVLPGTGHLLLRRYLKGAALAALYAASADVFLISAFLWPGGTHAALPWVSLSLMVIIWAYALFEVMFRLKVLREKDFQKRKDDLLKAAQVAWLKNDYPQAERLLRRIIALDERDVEAWVHLGKVLKSCAQEAEAEKCFRSALNLKGSEVWRWELMRELGYSNIKGEKA